MKAEYDFRKGQRGKFYRPGAPMSRPGLKGLQIRLPAIHI